MKNSKILISFLLILLIAVSVSAVSASADVDKIASTAENDIVSEDIVVSGDSDKDISDAIKNAKAGDTIDLGKNKIYTINNTVTVDKAVTLKGDNVTFNGEAQTKSNNKTSPLYNGLVDIKKTASGAVISGITFINVNANKNYTNANTLKGYGVQIADGASKCIIENCNFTDFNNGIYISGSDGNTIKNSWFTGVSTLINNLPSGPKDRGSYAISIMKSANTLIFNNTFYGPLCDGVSIAGGSGRNNTILGNRFEGNAYAIYFGGASTAGSLIENNTFLNCGNFEADVINSTGDVVGHVKFEDLPVISVQKAADDFKIIGNKFYVNNNNVLIGANEANTAHGYPSDIGNIVIKNNVVELNSPDTNAASAVFVNIISEKGILNPVGPIDISNNTLGGIKGVVYWSYDWGTNSSGDVLIPAANPAVTYFEFVSVGSDKIIAILKDVNGKALAGKTVQVVTGAVNASFTTDEKGIITVESPSTTATLTFAGDSSLAKATSTINITSAQPVVPVKKDTVISAKAAKKVYKVKAKKYIKVALKSENLPIAGKKVTVKVNGKTFKANTNSKGKATVKVTLKKKGTYKFTAKFAGDDTYNGKSTSGKIKVKA